MRGGDPPGSDSGARAHMNDFWARPAVIPFGTQSGNRLQRTVCSAACR